MKNILIAVISMLALSLSACGSTDSSAGELSQPESTTTVATTLSAPNENESESANDAASRIDGSEEENSFSITTSAPSESITEETTVEEETTTETTGSTSRTETTSEPKATTTSKAVTSSATTAKKATTTTKTVAQTTTTTKKAATTTTTAKQATTTTTTRKTTTTTTQAASTVEWTPLMRAYQHWREATLDVMDAMDKYDASIYTDKEVELIRKDICDYGLNTFNGKQIVTLHTEDGIKTLDFLRPLELTVDTTLYCYQQGTWVLGDAHLNCSGGQSNTWVPKKTYLAMTDEQKYNLAVEDRQAAHELMENALYRWYDYAGQAYAYIMTYNFGIDNASAFWLLTK